MLVVTGDEYDPYTLAEFFSRHLGEMFPVTVEWYHDGFGQLQGLRVTIKGNNNISRAVSLLQRESVPFGRIN
jgi:hypothetical protein